MKVLLLQSSVYLPSLGGGNKANRMLLEGLARGGNRCAAVSSALVRRVGLQPRSDVEEMRARGIEVKAHGAELLYYRYRGVEVEALNFPSIERSSAHVARRIGEFRPDVILVSDDRQRFLLKSALDASVAPVVLLVHTNMHLPFGPLSAAVNEEQARLFERAAAIVVVSRYGQEYLREHGGLESTVLPFPVYGDGPFPVLGRFETGFVTMINPCEMKGLGLFLALAGEFPQLDFAAVPTWGADGDVLRALSELPNIRLLAPVDDIEEILARTRVLVAPSIVPETFGYVVLEAMLRGIPALANDVGGMREAKLGVDYLFPRPSFASSHAPRDVALWSEALSALLSDREIYERCACASRSAALKFVSKASVSSFEEFLRGVVDGERRAEKRDGNAESMTR
jgi:glycosyltransferase involved in cell wall biosynthesis